MPRRKRRDLAKALRTGCGTRGLLAEMGVRYARAFQIELELVAHEMWEDGEGKVWCPSRADLPVWTLNQSEAEYQGRAQVSRLGPRAQRRLEAKTRDRQ